MKKMFTLLVLCAMTLSIQAQEIVKEKKEVSDKKHEIAVSVGVVNDVQMIVWFADMLGTIFTLGYFVQPDKYYPWTPSISYRYWFNERFGLGAAYAFDMNSVQIRKESDADFEIRNRYFSTIVVEGVLHYMNRPYCQIYGMLGLGVTIANIPKSEIRTWAVPNFHVAPFGVRVGRNYGGFLELGWGYKGILNVGFSAKF